MLTLYDAPRCPYCARVRIVVAEKGVEVETIEIDLDDRPAWIYEKNSTGRVPVVEEDGWTLPESAATLQGACRPFSPFDCFSSPFGGNSAPAAACSRITAREAAGSRFREEAI